MSSNKEFMSAKIDKDTVATTAPISSYDYFTPEVIKSIERSIRSTVGAKSEMVLIDHGSPRSIFVHSGSGLICGNCGTRQANADPIACHECGAAYIATLVIGLR